MISKMLSEITSVITKGTTPTSVGCSFSKNGINYIKSESITSSRTLDKSKYAFISEETHQKLKRSQIKENDILFSMAGMFLGKTGIVQADDVPANTNQAVAIIRIVPEQANYLYVYYYLNQKNIVTWINSLSGQSAQPNINLKQIGEIEIPLPDRIIQDTIVEMLSAIDSRIELNTAINENLEQQAQAIFKAWFVDFEPFGGVMPDDWSECILDSMCSLIIKGITPKYIEHSAQFVINQKCVRNHQIDLSLARCHEPKKVNEKWLQYGDIVVNSTGTGTLGRAAQVLFTPNNMTVDSHVTIIRASKQEYIYYLGLWATSHEHDFEMLQTGSTGQTDLPRERLKQMPVILPSDDILCKFSEIIKPIADIRIKNQQENQSLAALRDTLLPKLMNGEIDVSEVKV